MICPERPSFLFATCQRGAERALKAEMSPLRLAYSRPGFLTFKVPASYSEQELMGQRWTFARTHGISLCKLAGRRLFALAKEAWQHPTVMDQVEQVRFGDMHVWQRDVGTPGRHGYKLGRTPLALEVERALREAAPTVVQSLQNTPRQRRRPTGRGQNVLDVVVVEPDEWWIGWHRVSMQPHRWPGGIVPLDLPAHAVSRAYLKMEEALSWSDFPLRPGEHWVELGCAPGGASQALLDHDQRVTGIDPAETDESLLTNPRFRHIQKRVASVRRREFRSANWLSADLNVAPSYTLDAVESIVTHRDVSIRGMILTLKLLEWTLAGELPQYLERIRGWGYRDIRARQLVHNAQEVCVVALRRRALRRLPRQGRRMARGVAPSAVPHEP